MSESDQKITAAASTRPSLRNRFHDAAKPSGGQNAASDTVDVALTFVFLNDTHADATVSSRNEEIASTLSAIQALNGTSWPAQALCSGQAIDIQAMFVNGDLCASGGGAKGDSGKNWGPNAIQFLNNFPSGVSNNISLYLGLGNHDLDSFNGTNPDFYRQQMWGLHSQWTDTNPDDCIQTVTLMDQGNRSDSDDWKNYSQNWLVDTSPVIFIQLHRFGGDTNYGHAAGLGTLALWLAQYPGVPIVLMQHFGFDSFSTQPNSNGSYYWTQNDENSLMQLFVGRTVIGVFHGHTHEAAPGYYTATPAMYTSENPLSCFSPGSVMTSRRFGLAYIGTNKMDVLFYYVDGNGNAQLDGSLTRYGLSWGEPEP